MLKGIPPEEGADGGGGGSDTSVLTHAGPSVTVQVSPTDISNTTYSKLLLPQIFEPGL